MTKPGCQIESKKMVANSTFGGFLKNLIEVKMTKEEFLSFKPGDKITITVYLDKQFKTQITSVDKESLILFVEKIDDTWDRIQFYQVGLMLDIDKWEQIESEYLLL